MASGRREAHPDPRHRQHRPSPCRAFRLDPRLPDRRGLRRQCRTGAGLRDDCMASRTLSTISARRWTGASSTRWSTRRRTGFTSRRRWRSSPPARRCSARSRWRSMPTTPSRWSRRRKRAGVINMVNLTYRNAHAIQMARRMIAAGEIGEMRHVEASYLQSWLTGRHWGDWRTDERWLWRLSSAHGSKRRARRYRHPHPRLRHLSAPGSTSPRWRRG